MGKPDALSRCSDHGTGTQDNENITLLPPTLFAVWALEGILIQGEGDKILQEICQGNRDGHQEEPVAKAAKALRSSKSKSVQSMEWSLADGLLLFRGKIYVPNLPDL